MTILPSVLKAIAHCASTDPTRLVRNSVLIEQHPTGTRYVATNGRVLACAVCGVVPGDSTPEVTALIPLDWVARIAKEKQNPWVELTGTEQRYKSDPSQVIPYLGTYPQWTQVIPKAGTEVAASPEILIAGDTVHLAYKALKGLTTETGTRSACVMTHLDGPVWLATTSRNYLRGVDQAWVICMGIKSIGDPMLQASKVLGSPLWPNN